MKTFMHKSKMLKKIFSLLTILALSSTWVAPSLMHAQIPAAIVSIDVVQKGPQIYDTVDIDLLISGAQKLGGYQYDFTYDPAILEFVSAKNSAFFAPPGGTVVELPVKNDPVAGKVTFGVFSFGSTTGVNGNGIFSRITFKAKANGTSPLRIDNVILVDVTAATQPAGVDTESVTVGTVTPTPLPSNVPNPSPSIGPNPTPLPNTAVLSLSLPNPVVVLNQEFTVDLAFSTSEQVAGVDAVLLYDNTRLEAVRVDDKKLLPITPKTQIDPEKGVVRVSQLANPTEPYSGTGLMAQLIFKPKELGEHRLSFEYTPTFKKDSNAIAAATGQDILVQPQDLTFSVAEKPRLSVGLTTPAENGDNSITGKLSDENNEFSTDITTDASGTANAVDLPESFTGRVVNFFFKASGFLRQKFTATVNPGENTVNIGSLRGGDLNDNGVINDDDLAIMYQGWYGQGLADYNRDGVINSADYWVITKNYLQSDQ